MFKSCNCLSSPPPDTMEAPIPRHFDLDADKENTKPGALVRKGSKLQVSVEVFKCKFGKPSAIAEAEGPFAPTKEWTPLYYAVHHQREAALSHFLRAGDSPNDVNDIGLPPLCIAVANGHVDIVNILLEAGADINAVTKDGGETALHLAIKNSRSDLIDLILSCGPDLEAQTGSTGETPLHYAASKSGSLATIVSLLKLGAKYDSRNTKGQTPAEAALQANNLHGAVAIINATHGKRNKLTKEKDMLLKHVQKTNGRFSIGNDLIADIFTAACDPDSTVLIEAIKRDDASLVQMFLEKGSDPDRETANGMRPLFVALQCASAPVIQALVKHHADVSLRDTNGLTVLQAALESPLSQDKEAMSAIFDCMLERGADAAVAFQDGQTLLHRVVSPQFGHARVAHLLISAGIKVDTPDHKGNTALHLATHSKSCLEILLKNGANARQDNLDGLSPLLYAATFGNKDKEPDLDALVRVSDLRQTNSDDQTVLHLAAKHGLEKLVRLLLRARAETMLVDSDKLTPLLLAVKNHQWAVVPLLTIPPSINSWDQDGLSALHHIARSTPQGKSTWKDIATAAVPFCERGVSRSMRDRSGATPLIQAIKTLPEEGLPVVEALLMQKTDRRASFNCVSHEDHQRCDALYYAATMQKAAFVETLLKHGAMFTFEDWTPSKKKLQASNETDKQVMKLLAQYEWARRAGSLRRQSGGPDAETAVFSTAFPTKDIKQMVSMGLSVNALPRSPLGTSMLWAILRHIPLQPHMTSKYIYETIKIILDSGADPNFGTARTPKRSPSPIPPPPRAFLEATADQNGRNSRVSRRSPSPISQSRQVLLDAGPNASSRTSRSSRRSQSPLPRSQPPSAPPSPRMSRENLPLSLYPITFLLEEFPSVDIDLITLLLTKGAKLSVASPFYGGRFALHAAVKANRMDLVDEFLLQRADVNCADQSGRTPLFVAAEKGFWEIVDALLRRGAKVNIEDDQQNTPLHAAAIGGVRRIVAALLRSGAKANTKNKKGETPLACVAEDLDEKERDKILPMLRDSLERERRDEERNRIQKEQNAAYEARIKARRDEELKARKRREEEEKEQLRKEQEFNAKLQRERDERDRKAAEAAAAAAAAKSSGPPKSSRSSRSSLFRKSSLLAPRPKVPVPPVFQMPKQTSVVSMRITTPPSLNKAPASPSMAPTTFASPKPEPPTTATQSTAALPLRSATTDFYGITAVPTPSDSNPTPKAPRIDSGFGQIRSADVDKPLPALDRNKANLGGDANGASGGELNDWLALTKMLDNL